MVTLADEDKPLPYGFFAVPAMDQNHVIPRGRTKPFAASQCSATEMRIRVPLPLSAAKHLRFRLTNLRPDAIQCPILVHSIAMKIATRDVVSRSAWRYFFSVVCDPCNSQGNFKRNRSRSQKASSVCICGSIIYDIDAKMVAT